MVEGHSVHRVATFHRQRLVGKCFQATSPNGRFTEGAKAVDGKLLSRIEAVGKNLFAFFGSDEKEEKEEEVVVVHIHFGMAGAWAVYRNGEAAPEPSPTNRLRLHHPTEQITADLSAMTCNFGDMDLYKNKRAKLGEDPLRTDADPELLWTKVKASKKSIGALIMDQSFFAGPGNIYRAEILFKAGVHPDIPGKELTRDQFDWIWHHTVALLQRGYETGSILTVDPEEARQLGQPQRRRYIYNSSHCPRCQTRIKTWSIASRTCYACPTCQPRLSSSPAPTIKNCVPFHSHCAREPAATRLATGGPTRLTIQEIRAELAGLGVTNVPLGLKKAVLVKLLEEKGSSSSVAVTPDSSKKNALNVKQIKAELAERGVKDIPSGLKKAALFNLLKEKRAVAVVTPDASLIKSSEAAAAEKAAANESLAVEHIAELGQGQARLARLRSKRERSDDENVAAGARPKRLSRRQPKQSN